MKSKLFLVNVSIRLTLLFGNMALFCFYYKSPWPVWSLMLLGFIAQFVLFLNYLQRTHRDLHKLFEAIKYDDFSFTFSRKPNDKHLDLLYASFNNVMSIFRSTRMKGEEYRHFLKTVVQHVGIPLLAFDTNRNIEIVNSSAKKFLKVNRLNSLKELSEPYPDFYHILLLIKNGEKRNVKFVSDQEVVTLAIYGVEFIIEGRLIKLITLVNISRELAEKELESWLALLKVLTHEIMNSMTPISSLSSSVSKLLAGTDANEHKIEQIIPAIETIERRSTGMVKFLSSFRSLTSLPRPEFSIVPLAYLFKEIESLVSPELSIRNISFSTTIDPSTLQITADKQLIIQVLINLIANAREAVESSKSPIIQLSARMTDNQVVIAVEDNGPGILSEVQEKVFIPFFTTKKAGSGIGLSISRLIMQAHKGVIKLESFPEKNITKVSLVF